MQVEHTTSEVLAGPLHDLYVYEAPVRLAHWLFAICIPTLAVTGYFIGSPLHSNYGDTWDTSVMGWFRLIHFTAGYLLAVTFVFRLYWAFVGNHSARAIFFPPVWRARWWKGVVEQAKYYLFIGKERLWVGHNPLAQGVMFLMFTLGTVFMILTGFALYAQQWGWGLTPMNLFGWQFKLFQDPQTVRTLHHLGMWYILLFVVTHIYMVFREDIMSGQSVISTMVNGIRMWKRAPRKG